MKYLLLALGCLVSLKINAQVVKTCSSIHEEIPAIELVFDESQTLSKVLMEGSTFFEVDAKRHDLGFYFDISASLENYPLAVYLRSLAMLSGPYKTVQATLITLTENSNPWLRLGTTFDLQMEKISDDASGVMMLEFFNEDNFLVGSSILVGWGGVFHNCQ